ncbi:Postreplication repair E3 ubiquitin-protein ligase rad18 [Vanrija pseudolonga]|uniref:Postreplication repair E3 ubiquitin-protein ligase RAD18 n=1 Tax=Vanrija pseudolonga TaxID=143232 RepID=A0AAF0Y734_9TREE|nr:Postreplication repair E3 ubiquitin-protein ligase rad18 [Vanrija pseudolonga]
MDHPLLAADDPLPPFPASYPQLSRVDRAVSCAICKELYKGPVSIACGHSFCSACIRSFLDTQKKCPTCHEPAKEGSIRRNRALEEMTDAWEGARPSLLELAQPKKRVVHEAGPSKRKRASSSPRRTASPDSDVEVLGDDDSQELTDKDEQPCPLCAAVMATGDIPLHIDRGCPPPKGKAAKVTASSGNQKADWKKVFASAGGGKTKVADMRRIVKPNYSLTGQAELRALLTEHGLPTTGERPALEARFQEWIVLYNANLDTSHPSSLPALRAQLAQIESSRKRDKDRGKDDEVGALQTKEGMHKHAQDQRSEFERLRQQILDRKAKKTGMAVDSPIEVE